MTQPFRRVANLSPREREVLEGIAAGLTVDQIADAIGLSRDTVKTHLTRAYDFLGVRNSSHALVVAHELGYLPLDCGGPGYEEARNTPQHNRLDRRQIQGPRYGQGRQPIPEDIGERFPSTTWGEEQWFAALQGDQDLYFAILAGIGKATAARRAPAKGCA